jgi:hypothetical protein
LVKKWLTNENSQHLSGFLHGLTKKYLGLGISLRGCGKYLCCAYQSSRYENSRQYGNRHFADSGPVSFRAIQGSGLFKSTVAGAD